MFMIYFKNINTIVVMSIRARHENVEIRQCVYVRFLVMCSTVSDALH